MTLDLVPDGYEARYLLCGCIFLKIYSTEAIHSRLDGVDSKTFRKRTWCTLDALSSLQLVRNSNTSLTYSDRMIDKLTFAIE